VGDQDEGEAAFAPEPVEQGDDVVPGAGVEVARRLIGQQDLGLFDQGAGDADPLLLAAGQLGRQVPCPLGETDLVQCLRGPGPPLGGAGPGRDEGGLDVSCAVSVGTRLKVWKTKPIEVARTLVSRLSRKAPRSWPSNSTVPEVGRSSPPSSCSSVVLPWPVGPWIASHSPSSMTRSTPRSAATVRRPFW
jgi:hypothetical protein